MTRSRFTQLLILLLICIIAPVVNAADGDPSSFIGKFTYEKGINTTLKWDLVHGGGNPYQYYEMTVQYKDRVYRAYCINPGAPAAKTDLTCTKLSASEFPHVYYALQHYGSTLAADPIVGDLVIRTLGLVDNYQIEETQLEHAALQQECVAYESVCRQKYPGDAWNYFLCSMENNACWQLRMQAVLTSTQQLFSSPETFDNRFAGYTLHDVTVNPNDMSTAEKTGTVALAMQIVKESMSGEVSKSDDDGNVNGQHFDVSVSENVTANDGSYEFNVSTKDGKVYDTIEVSAKSGTAKLYTWNGTSGTIKVTPEPGSCDASFSISTGECMNDDNNNNNDDDPDPPGPDPVPKPNPCKCYVKGKKTYTYCAAPVYQKVCDYGEKRTCRNVQVACNETKTGWRQTKICYTESIVCDHIPDNMKLSADANDELETVYPELETEHELVYDNRLAYNNELEDNSVIQLANESSSSSSALAYLCTKSGDANNQSYIAIVDQLPCQDDFEITLPCNGQDSQCYTGNCSPVGEPTEFIDVEVHNCCEEGARTKGRQYALNELFCDYSNGGMYIPNFAERCNGDEYKDETPINDYCEQYCSTSFYYDLPGPTHSKQDRYFYWTKRNGATGPVINQFKRCRTLIHYDEWYAAYTRNVDAAVGFYNGAQEQYAYYNMWNDLIENVKGTETIAQDTITCKSTWTWNTHDGTCSCTPVYPATSCTPATNCDNWHTAEGDSASQTVPAFSIKIYDTSLSKYHDTNGNYAYGVLKRYGDETIGHYSYSKIILDTKKTPTDKNKYYNQSDATTYTNGWNTIYNKVHKAAEDNKPSGAQGSPSTSCSYRGVSIPNQRNPDTVRSTYLNQGNALTASHLGSAAQVEDLKQQLNTCGGEVVDDVPRCDDPDTCNLLKRVEFGKEPEMEFSYAAKYIGMDGTENDQEIPVQFDKVDEAGDITKKCIVSYFSGFDEGLEGDQFNFDSEYEDGTKYFGNYRDKYTYSGVIHAKLQDMMVKGAGKLNSVVGVSIHSEWYGDNSYKNKLYYADKKFTTDAMSHMTCRWVDVPEEEVYTIIPNGVILEEEATGQLCSDTPYKCINYRDGHGNEYPNDGIYHTYKGHVAGKFETYFTLYNICTSKASDTQGLFDDIIHEIGIPCSEQKGLQNYNGRNVNATCYIEIKNEFAEYFDCSGAKVLSKDDRASEECGGNTTPKLLYDYKVVDTEDMFDESYVQTVGGGFAHNWVTDPTGKAKLAEMKQDGKDDVTYAPEKLTYSFTLTPSDLRQIREYNQTRVEHGGYTDFELYCTQSADLKTMEKCKSRFLEAISGGEPLTSGPVTLELDTKNIDLAISRSRIWGGA